MGFHSSLSQPEGSPHTWLRHRPQGKVTEERRNATCLRMPEAPAHIGALRLSGQSLMCHQTPPVCAGKRVPSSKGVTHLPSLPPGTNLLPVSCPQLGPLQEAHPSGTEQMKT